MSKCENCIHYSVCEFKRSIDDTLCGHYKDKSLFVELPCKVGELIFVIDYCRCTNIENYRLGHCHKKKKHNTPEILTRVMKLKKGRVLKWNGFVNEWAWADKDVICYKLRQKPFDLKMITEIGKTVFVDKADAEQKLKELENGK